MGRSLDTDLGYGFLLGDENEGWKSPVIEQLVDRIVEGDDEDSDEDEVDTGIFRFLHEKLLPPGFDRPEEPYELKPETGFKIIQCRFADYSYSWCLVLTSRWTGGYSGYTSVDPEVISRPFSDQERGLLAKAAELLGFSTDDAEWHLIASYW